MFDEEDYQPMIVQSLQISPGQLIAQTGWELKPQGACKGEQCIPLPKDIYTTDGKVKLEILARRLNLQLVRAGEDNLWALGPQAGSKALAGVDVPDLTLPDLVN